MADDQFAVDMADLFGRLATEIEADIFRYYVEPLKARLAALESGAGAGANDANAVRVMWVEIACGVPGSNSVTRRLMYKGAAATGLALKMADHDQRARAFLRLDPSRRKGL